MQQIRFDFLAGVNGGNNRSNTANANASEQSGDAFARILDQQIARRGDDAVKSRAAEPRSRSRETSDTPQTLKRRDDKSTAATAKHDKPETKAQPKVKQPEKNASDHTTCAKPAAKPATDETDQTSEAAAGTQTTPEGEVARRVARRDWGMELRWVDDRSRDTEEGARLLRELMRPDQVRRIALVTDAWHMPRAEWRFRQAGFDVVPAPMGFAAPRDRPLLEWLPSTHGLTTSRAVLREWVGLRVAGR